MNGDAAAVLALWESGERQRPSGRVAAMLQSAAAPEDGGSLTVGQRDALLIALRRELFGDRYLSVTTCPTCGESIEIAFDTTDVVRDAAEGSTMLTVDGVTFRLPVADDLAAIETMTDVAAARAALLRRCCGDAAVPEELAAAIGEAMAKADPQADVMLPASCAVCGDRWREPFDIASFLWSEIAAAARRLLREVHVLAMSYGWSEREILSLTPARRHAYLEMVQWTTS